LHGTYQALRCAGACDSAEADACAREPLSFVHAAAEATGRPAASADLVAACLVAHELPAAATRALLAEALRLLRPQGSIAIMVRTREHRDWSAMRALCCAPERARASRPSCAAWRASITSGCRRIGQGVGQGMKACALASQSTRAQEMDPASAAFQRVFDNPFAYAAFKSTEPWLLVCPPIKQAPRPLLPTLQWQSKQP